MALEPERLARARQAMQAAGIEAWLVYDFRGSNPVMAQWLGGSGSPTRRAFLLLGAEGEPVILGHAIEKHLYENSGAEVRTYGGRRELAAELDGLLQGLGRVAMEYSPEGALPALSWVDGGTLESVRKRVGEVVPAADLYEAALAVWDETALESHQTACGHVVEVKDLAFDYVRRRLGEEGLDEAAVQRFILDEFERRGLDPDHPPIVAVNANSGNPHYAPAAGTSAPLRRGDWLLVDLWARQPGRRHVFGDITWVACCGAEPSASHMQVFDAVRRARDAVFERLCRDWSAGRRSQGCAMDRVARQVIDEAGFGPFFVHRTGHSLGPGPAVHGLGANLDDFETRDTRPLLPGTGFTIEPGVYLPEFGVRLEVNVYIDPKSGPLLTTPAQEDVVSLA